MKGRKPNRSWDDVFPDRHLSALQREAQINMLPLVDSEEPLANHGHSNSWASTADSHHSLPFTFSNCSISGESRSEDLHSVRVSTMNKMQTSNSCLSSLEKDVAELRARLECNQDSDEVSKRASDCACCSAQLSRANASSWRCSCFKDLIEDISMLELEVAKLEQYLLQLYRTVFSRRSALSSYVYESLQSITTTPTAGEGLLFQPNHPFNAMWPESPSGSSIWRREAIDMLKGKDSRHSEHISLPPAGEVLHTSEFS